MTQSVYTFGPRGAEGDAKMRNLLGGKGANLAEMSKLGIPVPPGFTITTEVCRQFRESGGRLPDTVKEEVRRAVAFVEHETEAKFGASSGVPLLFSVRSGARVSMPGMMDTVLNLGLNDKTVQALISSSSNERFAYDSYRRFVQMYGDVVLDLKPETKNEIDPFEECLANKKRDCKVRLDTELGANDLQALVGEFKKLVNNRKNMPFPEDPWEQLWGAIEAVFRSWDNRRAVTYRQLYNIPSEWGTAVTVQAMVFGNLGDDCATGVAFTRDPSTGERRFFGEFLVNAQGEDVVAGIRTPQPIDAQAGSSTTSLKQLMPGAYADLEKIYQGLEKHFRDMQDIEFTVQHGRLWMLQTRTGKRTARAMVKIAVDMVAEGLITRDEALLRMEPQKLDELLHPMLDPQAERTLLARGLPASPGAAVGKVVFHADDAMELAAQGEKVILVRIETSPEDIHGMSVAQGIVTARGGMTSHAAVVARGMGKCCVAGCGSLFIDYHKEEFSVETGSERRTIRKGDTISLDGGRGEVLLGAVALRPPALDADYDRLMTWADEVRQLKVRTNADTPDDAEVARRYGAEGIGLCRTEHMFFGDEKIAAVREMILSPGEEGRRRALAKILPMQQRDFVGIFRAMDGFPVTVRLLDPPLHEFLPTEPEQQAELAVSLKLSPAEVAARVEALREQNPMLGHRGCRLGISYPEIYEAQTEAIVRAALEVKRAGIKVIPEIMIPLVGHVKELAILRERVTRTAERIVAEETSSLEYTVGTMIELPRACVTAHEIAPVADFFSFGTNDLTQTTYGISRDDAGKFLGTYVEQGIYPIDPFVALDRDGVGALMRIAVNQGRAARTDLHIGICGEHGGEPSSIEFCHELGFDYVSCSPFRIPVARLAAARASLLHK